ncbi:unnamed protein product [Urochloa humidicola]
MAAACVEAPAAAFRHHTAAQPAAPTMGTTEDYEGASCLGKGAFGAILKARHRGNGQAVAMKFLRDASGGGGGHEALLLRESLLLEAASAGNPYVVGSRGLARDPATGDLCLVMDYGGGSLRDAMRRQPGPLPESIVRAAMRQLLTGAKGMHDGARIMHRDIKPGNILFGDDKVLRFCDFGVRARR